MKKLGLLLSVMCLFSIASLAQEATESKGAQIKFEISKHDFGDVTQGEKVEHIFAFENTGSEPLILSQVLTTCGCTAPEWTRDPIAPGAKGTIKVVYNSAGRSGVQNKVIRVVSNAETPEVRLTIRANVLPKGGS